MATANNNNNNHHQTTTTTTTNNSQSNKQTIKESNNNKRQITNTVVPKAMEFIYLSIYLIYLSIYLDLYPHRTIQSSRNQPTASSSIQKFVSHTRLNTLSQNGYRRHQDSKVRVLGQQLVCSVMLSVISLWCLLFVIGCLLHDYGDDDPNRRNLQTTSTTTTTK